MTDTGRISYLLPIRCEGVHATHRELAAYLQQVARWADDVVVVDGSSPREFELHTSVLPEGIRHLTVDADTRALNGKAAGVITGVRAAANELVVIADDDVRYTVTTLRAVADGLLRADLVIPQNVFPREGIPWHARWDTARTLLNRAIGTDHPGTLGVRRSTFLAMGGYSGDVLFENLELVRTVRAWGGRALDAPGVYVARIPPSTDVFLRQRLRQAYDDLAQPGKQALMLIGGPSAVWAASRRRGRALAVAAAMLIALAELGRRRSGGREVFPPSSSLFAPAWICERFVCSWLALGSRLVLGGCRYRGELIRQAATPLRELRRRAALRRREAIPRGLDGPAPPHATHRRGASSAISHNGTRRWRRGGVQAPVRSHR